MECTAQAVSLVDSEINVWPQMDDSFPQYAKTTKWDT